VPLEAQLAIDPDERYGLLFTTETMVWTPSGLDLTGITGGCDPVPQTWRRTYALDGRTFTDATGTTRVELPIGLGCDSHLVSTPVGHVQSLEVAGQEYAADSVVYVPYRTEDC
jgi:hypothetical protein